MKLVDVRDTLAAHLHNSWSHPEVKVFYANAEPPDLAQMPGAFLFVETNFDDAVQANISPTPFHRMYGTLVITVFVKETSGTRVALSYLDELSDLFKFKNLSGVHTQAPRVGWEQSRDGWYSIDLRVSFYADSNA